MTHSVLVVLTSHAELGDTGNKTGFWLEEFAAPYYAFLDAGLDVTLASPAGGQPPLDPKSDAPEAQTDATRRFKDDQDAQDILANTRKLADVNASDYDAVFYPGGHGPLWDLVDDTDSIRIIESAWEQGKIVSAVCHAPIVFKHTTAGGEPLVKDKAVTGFTNSEEDAVGLTNIVPHLVEDTLKSLGGNYAKSDDWAPFIQTDGKLITGQNPASSEPVAEAVIAQLKT